MIMLLMHWCCFAASLDGDDGQNLVKQLILSILNTAWWFFTNPSEKDAQVKLGENLPQFSGWKMKKYFKPSPRITNTTSLSQTPNPFPTPIFFPFSQTNVRLFGAPELYSNRIFKSQGLPIAPLFSGRLGFDRITPSSSHHHLLANFFQQNNPFVSQWKTTSIRTPSLRLPPIFRNSQPENVSGLFFEATSMCIPTQSPNRQGNWVPSVISLRLLYIFSKIIGFGRFPSWYLFSIFSKIFRECFKASLFIDTTTFGIPLGKNCESPLNGTQREGCVPQSLLDFKSNHWSTSKSFKSNLHHLPQVEKEEGTLGPKTQRFVAGSFAKARKCGWVHNHFLYIYIYIKKTRSFLGVGRMKFQVCVLSLIFGALLKIPRILRVNFRRKSPWFLDWGFPWFCERHHTSTKPSKTPWAAPLLKGFRWIWCFWVAVFAGKNFWNKSLKPVVWLVVEPTHLKNMLVKLEIFPNFRGENKKYFSCHHLASQGFGSAKGSTFTTDPLGCSTIHQPKIEMTCPRLKMGELFIRLANQRPGFLSSNSHLTMGEDCTKHLVIALTWRLLGRGRFETWLTRSLHVRQHTMCLKFCWRYEF